MEQGGGGAPERDPSQAAELEELRRAVALTRELGLLSERLLAPRALGEKLKIITDAMVELFGADFARIWMVREADLCARGCRHAAVTEGEHLCRDRSRCQHLMASSGRYTHTDGGHRRVPLGSYKIGRIASGDDGGTIRLARLIGMSRALDLILTGNYMKESGMIRVSLELADVHSSAILWREALQEEYNNAFRLEDTVARRVVEGLRVHLSPEEQRHLLRYGAESASADDRWDEAKEEWVERQVAAKKRK